MAIIFITPECFPFAKSTGLADFVASLAKGVEKEGNNVKLILPRYGSIDPECFQIENMPKEFKFNFKGHSTISIVYKGILPNSLVSVFLIDNQSFFSNSKEVYISESEDYKRFDFFSHAALNLISALNLTPDVIHLFDSYTAGCLKLVKENSKLSSLKNATLILTLGQPLKFKKEFINLTIEGIEYADYITVASESYAKELILDQENPLLSESLNKKKGFFTGITMGADTDLYSPELDKIMPQNYSKDYFTLGKKKCKENLLEELKLECDLKVPLVSCILRLVPEEGIDILLEAIPALLSINLKLLVVGKGEKKYENDLRNLEQGNNNLRFVDSNNHIFEKKIFAGSDFLVSILKSDPYGMPLLVGMKYGAVPVAYFSSSVKDIVLDTNSTEPNGFIFKELSKEELIKAVTRAISCYKDRERWLKIVKNSMSFNSTLAPNINKYINLYKKVSKSVLLS